MKKHKFNPLKIPEKGKTTSQLYNRFVKLLLIMRISIFLMTVGLFQAFANTSYSQTIYLDVKISNSSIEDVLAKIEIESEFYFLYSPKIIDVNKKVDIDVKHEKIPEILNKLFADTDIDYLILNKQIILTSKKYSNKLFNEIYQPKNVSGTVTDAEGNPLPGVSVLEKETSNGTVTDSEGKYSINVSPRATIVFSFVGMTKQEILVGDRTTVDVELIPESIGLEEVIAIGYGTVKKVDLTGSVSSIQGDQISERQTTTVSDALQGALPGVSVTRTSGAPGVDATIKIRGITTIGNSNPLVIIDGIPGNISDVNPTNIESISVLKDAASASIYGSKAASGVILITTKRASSGQLTLGYSYEYGFDTPTTLPEKLSAVPYMKMANEIVWNDNGNTGTEYPTYAQDLIDNYPTLHAENPDLYPDTDYRDYLNNTAPRQSHVLTITAGDENIRTQASISYDDLKSFTDVRSYKRINARINNDVTINQKLIAHIDLQYLNTLNRTEANSYSLSSALFIKEPLEAVFNSNGTVANNKIGSNFFARLLRGGTSDDRYDLVRGKIALDFTPIKDLKISGIFAPSLNFDKNKVHALKLPMYNYDDPTTIVGYVSGSSTTSLTEYRNDGKSFTSQLLANYSKTFGNHSINLLAGYENFYLFNENLKASRDQYTLDNYPYLNLGPLDFRDNSGEAFEYGSRSFFGRALYNYKDKYLLQVNARYDASSRFYKDYRWGLFPSFSAGWVLSKESFLKNNPVLSYFKLRASYGSLGNERIGNYPYQATVSFGNSLFYQGSSVVSSQTAYIKKYAVQDISWEKTKSVDFGIDVNFLDNKLQIVADYFHKKTSDMLLPIEIPNFIGLENPDQNTGNMYVNGWEFSIGYKNNIGKLFYSVSGNIYDSKSIMGDLGGTQFLGSQVKFEGSEYNEWYGYMSERLYQTQDEVDNSATVNTNVRPGDIRYKDISGPNGVPDGAITPTFDKVLLGGSLPRYEYGGNIHLSYNNFDIGVIFQGVGKQNSYLTDDMIRPLLGGVRSIPSFILGKYWSKYNTDEQNQEVFYPRLSEISAGGQTPENGNNYVTSDYWIFNGRYFRLKNIVLGYTLPEIIVKKLAIQRLRVYGNITNLFSIDKYPQGWDPETTAPGFYPEISLSSASKATGYFITKSFLFGVSVNF